MDKSEGTILTQVDIGVKKLRAFLSDPHVLTWIEPHPGTMLEGSQGSLNAPFVIDFTATCLHPHRILLQIVWDALKKEDPQWRKLVSALFLKLGFAAFLVRFDIENAKLHEVAKIFQFINFFIRCVHEAHASESEEVVVTEEERLEGVDALNALIAKADFSSIGQFMTKHAVLSLWVQEKPADKKAN